MWEVLAKKGILFYLSSESRIKKHEFCEDFVYLLALKLWWQIICVHTALYKGVPIVDPGNKVENVPMYLQVLSFVIYPVVLLSFSPVLTFGF